MGNAIQSGIYKLSLSLLSILSFAIVFAQDTYVDTQGQEHAINIARWHLDACFIKDNSNTSPLSVANVKSLYRNTSQINYVPYSSMVTKTDYADFLIPSIESLRALSTDYFTDENFEVWMSDQYIIYQVLSSDYIKKGDFFDLEDKSNSGDEIETLLQKNNPDDLPQINSGVIFLYHDSVGFNKVVANDIEDDYFRLQISKYTFDAQLNDSIFSDEFKLKQGKFLNFFDEQISPLTAVQFNDKDLGIYYISLLHDEGALILLLNLDKRKIDLYRNAGQTDLADKLEQKLLVLNKSLAMAFLEKDIYKFSAVYVTDAKNRGPILNGETKNIFLDANLNLDTSIVLKEPFYLFARNGQVFETQAIDQNNMKKQEVTSNPVVQDALVIFDHENVQLMDPFPFYVRRSTAQFASPKKKKKKKIDIFNESDDYDSVKAAVKALEEKYDYPEIDGSEVGIAIAFNKSLEYFYTNALQGKKFNFRQYKWENNSIWFNNKWNTAPHIQPFSFPYNQPYIYPGDHPIHNPPNFNFH